MKVSVYCTVYNHGNYLRSALEGFVRQKTDFDFEVFVHDDASTDNSADIIREYAEKYPNIIKPIIQSENQMSKGVKIFSNILLPQMKGEYIASCEGDDYWCDDEKLQKQVDYLDAHPEYTACVHNTMVEDLFANKKHRMFDVEEDKDVTFEEAIQSKSYHTSSLMYRAEYAHIRPDFFQKAKTFGDAPLAILLTYKGKVRFLKDIMSVYRHGTEGSWSFRNELNMEKRAQSYHYYADMLKGVNEYTSYQHKELLDFWIGVYEVNAASFEGNKSLIYEEPYRTVFRKMSMRSKLAVFSRIYLKWLYVLRNRVRRWRSIKKRS